MNKSQKRGFVCVAALVSFSGCAPRTADHEHGPMGGRPSSTGTVHQADQPSKQQIPPRVQFTLCDGGLPVKGKWKCDPVFRDINGDGVLDLAAVARKGDGPHVWLGNGRGEWTDSSSGLYTGRSSCGGGLSFADVNGDRVLDLAYADHCHGVSVFLGDTGGNWTLAASDLYPADLVDHEGNLAFYVGAEDVDIGDVNGDGSPDMIAASSDNGGISVYHGDGTGKNWTRSKSLVVPTKSNAQRVMFVDIDRDGHLDIVASYKPGPRVWRGDGHGGWATASKGLPESTMGSLYRGLAIGDVNEDGRLDIASANWVDGPEVYLQQADGSWLKTPDVFPEMLGGAVGLALGDVDGDKHLDIVVSGRKEYNVGFIYGVFILYGDGQGRWTWDRNSGITDTGLSFTWGVALADVNGDGLLDIAAGSGGIVASVPGPSEPVIPVRLPVWCSQRAAPQ